jgi:hypothetical protein
MSNVYCKSKTIYGPFLLFLLFLLAVFPTIASEQKSDASSLAGVFLTDTPLINDLRVLSDEIGGRITGSAANERAIEWALQRFRHGGLSAGKESFPMVRRWLPKTASVTIEGDGLSFSPRVVAVPFSTASQAAGTTAALLYAGFGHKEDFQKLGQAVSNAFVLVETKELNDEDGLITGFFENGRPEINTRIQELLAPVMGMGPFQSISELATGTDTFDFMLQGIATTVPFQAASNYPSNYHAESDTFDKVDQAQLRINASIIATLTYGFAETDVNWQRHNRKQVEVLIDSLELSDTQKEFPPWQGWLAGSRGRRPD